VKQNAVKSTPSAGVLGAKGSGCRSSYEPNIAVTSATRNRGSAGGGGAPSRRVPSTSRVKIFATAHGRRRRKRTLRLGQIINKKLESI
jgi:hypothetical protein